MYKNEFEFKLSSPLNYAKDGLMEIAQSLTLTAPSAKTFSLIAKIKQDIVKAFKNQFAENKDRIQVTALEAKDSDDKDDGFPAPILMNVLYSSSVIDMSQFFDTFKRLLTSGVCAISPVTPKFRQELTTALYDDLSCEDAERLIGEYVINFFLSSILMKGS